ncbi:MAG: hypothetical protein JW776_15965 [Candidatus Lokiarchaeota archaeon]|nr:hypothetical protein [Candidatus Lokiarchaeota archaeon]
MPRMFEVNKKIKNLLSELPQSITWFANESGLAYCSAERHLLRLVIEGEAEIMMISGSRTFMKKRKGRHA